MRASVSSLYRPSCSLHRRFKSSSTHPSSPLPFLHPHSPAGTFSGRAIWTLDCGSFEKIRFMSSKLDFNSPAVKQVEVDEIEGKCHFLEGELDDYDGVVVNVTNKMEADFFSNALKASMDKWKQQGKRGVWIKLPLEQANLVEVAVKQGFWYHHAEPKYLMLVYWIPDTPNTLPANASHRIGVAAFVMNDNKQVLVVQENTGKFKGSGIWKFPTGVVEEGEDICDAAQREVKEETGVEAEFMEVLAFRQSHQAFFGKSDLFFVCMLRPTTYDIQIQEAEIEAAQWMPYEEYLAQPFVKNHSLLSNIMKVCSARINQGYNGFTPVPTASTFSDQKHFLYLNGRDLNKI